MILRLGLPLVLLAMSPLGRGCAPPETSASLDPAPEEAPAETGAVEALPPAPSLRVALAPDALAPAPGSPEAARGAALRLATSSLEAGAYEESLALLPPPDGSPTDELAAWLRGRALRALSRPSEAEQAFASLPATSRYAIDARVAEAELLIEGGAADRALQLLGGDSLRSEPRAALLRAKALDLRAGPGDRDAAVLAARTVWTDAPSTQADADATVLLDALEPLVAVELRRDLDAATRRGEAMGRRSLKKSVIDLLGPRRAELVALSSSPETACRGLYQLGRAYHKQREYSAAVPILQDADRVCPDGDDRVKMLYLLAQGRARSGDSDGGIRTFLRLADEHPEHSYADDGLWQASRLALDEGRLDEASRYALRLTRDFPEGDMRGETLWNLAWSALSDGRPADALPWLKSMGEGDPLGPQREHILQGRYWTARVQLDDTSTREAALDALAALALAHPTHWYGALAGWTVLEQDPPRGAQLAAALRTATEALRAGPSEPELYEPLRTFVEDPSIAAGLAYLRAGLPDEAAAELGRGLGPDPLDRWPDPASLLFASHALELAGDPARSHNLLRAACKLQFPELDAEHLAVLRHAWPRAFGELIAEHTRDYAWDPLLFQGLVREESAFAPAIVSWAGAMGLSQLMWPTAKETARRMGLRISRASLEDPSTNLDIGATYFEGLAERWSGHLPLAVASYNAGPGAVNKWVTARGDLRLDAWVETIPYDQTREYVKRVVGSWQAYRTLYGPGPALVPLRVGPVSKGISSPDPALPQ